jgi:hypothetical protein
VARVDLDSEAYSRFWRLLKKVYNNRFHEYSLRTVLFVSFELPATH